MRVPLQQIPAKIKAQGLTFRISWGMIVLALVYLYLSFHAFTGSQGIGRWIEYNKASPVMAAELESLKITRERLEAEAARLRDDGLNLESLDLKARRLLNVSDVKDIVIWLDEAP